MLGAIESDSSVIRYAAYRLLNDVYDTHFDMEGVFFAGKYALGPYDPSSKQKANHARLKAYWQARLKETARTP